MTTSVYGTPIFIGREKEIAQFESMLLEGPASEKWLLYLVGEGGVGKTQLLHRFIETTEKHRTQGLSVIAAEGLIDLYWTSNQSELGLLRSIAESIGKHHFGAFLDALERYEALFARPAGTAAELFEERLAQSRVAFFEAYNKLPAERVALFFDTAENSTDGVRAFWSDTLPKLRAAHHGTLIVLAGRPSNLSFPEDETVILPIIGFTDNEVAVYLRTHGYLLEEEVIERLTILSGGRPILIALAVDWLEVGYTAEDLIDCTPAQFERLMIRRVQELRYDEDQAILAMAHLYRRCNAQFISYILEIPIQKAENLVQEVAGFSFVKFRPATESQGASCLLHDEMRDLVNKYVWTELDPLGDYRRGWNKKIVAFYATLIDEEPNVFARHALRLERLGYWLDEDPRKAFQHSEELFQDARARRDTAAMETINVEVVRVKNRLDATLLPALTYREALVLHGRGHYERAQERLLLLLDDADVSLLQAAVRVELIESMIYGGDLPQAIELGESWLTWFESARTAFDGDSTIWQKLEYEFGRLCNNIGLAYRNQNKLARTIDYYERSLEHYAQAGSAYSEMANTKNNLGYVYHRLGRDDEALSQCGAALAIRQRLGSPEQLGYSYNVIAMIYVDQLRQYEAETFFKRAREEFARAGSLRGRGFVNIAYGRALRQLGRHKERNLDAVFDPDREEYRLAGEMLAEAINVFRELSDEPNLSEALNEIGTLRRQQKRWPEAIEHFRESMELSERTGNSYRQVDNMVDIAITYDYWGQIELALDFAERASKFALDDTLKLQAYNLFAKAQEVRANALYQIKEYEAAFEAVANACIYIMRLDPEKQGESPAKRELYYNEKLDWAAEKVLNLPDQATVHASAEYLIKRWREEQIDTKPGFVIRMQDIDRDYKFLTQNHGA